MAYKKIDIYHTNLEARLKAIKNWKIAEQDKKDIPKFLEDLHIGRINGKKVEDKRQLKYLSVLKKALEFFKKPTTQITKKDMDKFIEALFKKSYSDDYKENVQFMFLAYLKWKIKSKAKINQFSECCILKRSSKQKTPAYLSEQEAENLYKACKSAKQRYLICMLFDGGMRASEFFNLRKEDIELPQDKQNFVKVTLKEEYSKSSGRVINLFWKYSNESIMDYLAERFKQGIKPDEQVYQGTYDSARFFLRRLGKKVLNRKIYFHLFRHGSCTFYARKFKNRQRLCYRFGWKFSSQMPDIYISRSGLMEEEIEKEISQTEIEEVRKQNEKLKQELGIMKEDYDKKFETLAKNLVKLAVGKVEVKEEKEQVQQAVKKFIT